ncbi:ATP-binding protein [Candidatus Babeliales bacterium]|nr:ATP-binding protein [Candidatus Babeliales bacterium]
MRKKLFFIVGLVGILVSQGLFAMEVELNQIKIVLTGGPCSGKTSLIKAFKEREFNTIHEVATSLIKKGEVHPLKDGCEKFQETVCAEQKRLEDKAAQETEKVVWFLDRGMPDGAGYYKNSGLKVPRTLRDAIEGYKYNVIFILDPVLYTTDGSVRFEGEKVSKELHGHMIEAYAEAGYEPIVVKNFAIDPEQGVRNRMDFVLNKLAELCSAQFPPTS